MRALPTRRTLLMFSHCLLVGLSLHTSLGWAQGEASIPLKGAPEPQVISPLLAADLPDQLDRYAKAARELDGLSLRFQESYQRFIRTLDALSRTGKSLNTTPGCLVPELANPYLSARTSWERYHQQARHIRTVQRRIQLYEQYGYTPGLTPDLQDRIRRLLEDYERIRKEHVNIEALLKDQVEGEVRRIGCDPNNVTAPAPAQVAKIPTTKEGEKLATLGEKPGPRTGQELVVPQVPAPPGSGEDAEASGGPESPLPPPTVEQLLADEQLLPPDAPGGVTPSPAPYPGMENPGRDAQAAADQALDEASHQAATAEGEKSTTPTPVTATPLPPTPVPATPTPVPIPEGLRVRFSVDNRQCRQPVQVFLDGALLGAVPGEAASEFPATEGKHRLCLSQEAQGRGCANASDYIRVILYDGFAVRPRC
ncbi:MAG: hypothetical protein ACKO6N_19010 [Myxococcota bacterium]